MASPLSTTRVDCATVVVGITLYTSKRSRITNSSGARAVVASYTTNANMSSDITSRGCASAMKIIITSNTDVPGSITSDVGLTGSGIRAIFVINASNASVSLYKTRRGRGRTIFIGVAARNANMLVGITNLTGSTVTIKIAINTGTSSKETGFAGGALLIERTGRFDTAIVAADHFQGKVETIIIGVTLGNADRRVESLVTPRGCGSTISVVKTTRSNALTFP